jgi:hypothetical protein
MRSLKAGDDMLEEAVAGHEQKWMVRTSLESHNASPDELEHPSTASSHIAI